MMRTSTKLILIGIVVALVAVAPLVIRRMSEPRVIARAVAPDGTEFCVVQKFNWSPEMFTTSCYYRKPGGLWGWLYFDHQDSYWDRGRAVVDPAAKRVNLHRGGALVATFDWETEKYRLLRRSGGQNESIGAMHFMPADWEPGR